MNLWIDGRTGPAGCLAGNLVLAHLRDSEQETFSQRKGTTFIGRGAIWVGRMCSTDAYLYGRDRHWANLSLEQHREVTHEAALEGRAVKYLLITALAGKPILHYWVIPGQLVQRLAFDAPSLPADFVYSLHIRQDESGRFLLEGEDVTQYHHVLPLDAAASSRLDKAFDAVKRRNERRQAAKHGSSPGVSDFAEVRPESVETGDRRRGEFHIPLKGGRSAVLELPLPAAEVDLHRIKGWIDLMNDVLTEPLEDQAAEARRARAAGAVSELQAASNASGTDKLTDREIEQEIHRSRRERR